MRAFPNTLIFLQNCFCMDFNTMEKVDMNWKTSSPAESWSIKWKVPTSLQTSIKANCRLPIEIKHALPKCPAEKYKEGVIGCMMLDVVLLHLSPAGHTSSVYRQADVVGNTFGLVWSLSGAPEKGEIRLADKGSGHWDKICYLWSQHFFDFTKMLQNAPSCGRGWMQWF